MSYSEHLRYITQNKTKKDHFGRYVGGTKLGLTTTEYIHFLGGTGRRLAVTVRRVTYTGTRQEIHKLQ